MTGQTMLRPGVHCDIPEDIYHADPCERPSLSSSIGKVILAQSPLHAWTAHPRLNPEFETGNERKFDIGKAVHAMLLDDRAERICVIDFADYKTNAAKAARANALAAGQLPLKTADYEQAVAIVQSARREIALFKEYPEFIDGVSEVTLIWEEPGGVLCRARIDRMSNDRRHLFDVKTDGQSAHPESFGRKIINMGYDFSAAFYLRGFRKCFPDLPAPEWSWLAVETDPPYGVSITGLDEAGYAIAEHQVEIAIAIWRECMASGKWPGYPHKKRIIETKPWALTGHEQLKASIGFSTPSDSQAIRDRMLAWQAPINQGEEQ
ncbi:MAG: hypothetical protein Dbin4_02964 [Alphaproteobacteria bacterium]|nr:hypothetical protein [Alphaproteobacteria bacterium]